MQHYGLDTASLDTASLGAASPSASTPNYLGINPKSKSYASQVQAALTRKQFDDFLMYSYPALQQQAGMVNNPAYMNQQREQARSDVSLSLADAPDRRERSLKSYGVSLSPEEAAVAAKGDKLAAVTGDVNAFNRSTQQVKDREWQILSGASGASFRPGKQQ